MSERHNTTPEPETEPHHSDDCVAYVTSRRAARAAVLGSSDIVLVDAAVRGLAEVVRWLVTMTTERLVAVVGDVPAALAEHTDASLNRPVSQSAIEALKRRAENRSAYAEAVASYYRAVTKGADQRELESLRRVSDECGAVLDAADRRAVLDVICV